MNKFETEVDIDMLKFPDNINFEDLTEEQADNIMDETLQQIYILLKYSIMSDETISLEEKKEKLVQVRELEKEHRDKSTNTKFDLITAKADKEAEKMFESLNQPNQQTQPEIKEEKPQQKNKITKPKKQVELNIVDIDDNECDKKLDEILPSNTNPQLKYICTTLKMTKTQFPNKQGYINGIKTFGKTLSCENMIEICKSNNIKKYKNKPKNTLLIHLIESLSKN